jgi:excisionase family DNA binding protein
MNDYGDAFARSRNYCTTREAADRLGVSLRTAQLWVDSGILTAWKTEGGHRRISLDSVESLLREKASDLAPKVQPIAPTSQSSDRLKLLVVEDDNVLLKLYRVRITAWNLPIDLTTASNGYEALVLIGREQPDLMITDLRMPGIDGIQMVNALLASSFREGMEIIVVTGIPGDAIDGLPPGLKRLTKPVPFNELKTIVEHLLARRAELGQA